jgi:hypothetical protein
MAKSTIYNITKPPPGGGGYPPAVENQTSNGFPIFSEENKYEVLIDA